MRILVVSVLLCTATACWSSCIYYPTRVTEQELDALVTQQWRIDRVLVEPDVEVVGLVRPPVDDDIWLLYFGGNAMSIAKNLEIVEVIASERQWGLALWSYRGYDLSGGDPDEEALISDAVHLIRHLRDDNSVSPERMVLVGHSLGTGVVSRAAATLHQAGEQVAAIVLLSPFTSIPRIADASVPLIPVGWSIGDDYDSQEALAESSGPVLIIHGVHDTVVSVQHGRDLAAQLGERVTYLEVNRGHNDFWTRPSPAVEPIQHFVDAAVSR